MDTAAPGPDGDGTPPSDPSSLHLELFRTVLGTEPLGQVLDRVARLARSAVPGVDEVSVTLVQDGRARSAAFTDDLAVRLDERQYEDGFGPCLDASRTGRVVQVPDTSADDRYPDFARQAQRSGVTRTMSVGLPIPGATVGALNLYARSGHGFHDATVAGADTFAGHAAVALANAASHARATGLVAQMQEAMVSRAVIEQAKGMIMAARGCSDDEAFTELSRMSARANRKVRDLAAEIVEARGRSLG